MPEQSERYQSVAALQADIETFLLGGGWFETRALPAGTLIVEEGAEASEAYIIVEGRCEAFRSVGGRRISLRQMAAPEVFGETAVLTGGTRTASVIALGPVLLKVVTRDALEEELKKNPWLGAFSRALAERFKDVDGKLTWLRERFEV
jgi:CRP-like cAMP-binding protein